MLWIIIGIIVSFFLGSIPTAYLFGRVLKGIDIREFGSGNVGATNALRVLGKPAGITVLVLDILKGAAAVIFLGDFLTSKINYLSSETLRLIAGVACVCGHNWTVFLRFKGGKGVAATLGVLLGLAARVSGLQPVLGLVMLTWLAVFLLTHIVSVASVFAAVALPIFIIFFKPSNILIFSGTLLSIFTLFRHKANIKRFFQGKEKRIF